VQAQQNEIKKLLVRLQKMSEKGNHSAMDEETIFHSLEESAQIIKYFGGLLEQDDEVFAETKELLCSEFEKYIQSLSN
jgi:nitrate reductase assembly molybdenum cofactor insertion protein NarJ